MTDLSVRQADWSLRHLDWRAQYALTGMLLLGCVMLPMPWKWQSYSFFLFMPAVILGAMFGRGPALFATAGAILLSVFFWIDPVNTLWMTASQIPPLALYLMVCMSVVIGFDLLHASLIQRSPGVPAALQAASGKRFEVLDFWRGFILCTIFINHLPGNALENYTTRNLGLSDSAEAFVFLSGMSLALAYERRFVPGNRLAACRSLAQRALKLYGVHILLSLAAIAIFTAGAIYFDAPQLLNEHGRGLFVENPVRTLGAIALLTHQLGYFNILPLYIVLILAVPAYLWLGQRDLRVMLALSAAIYVVARATGLNMMNWPQPGTWFLNPFTWQFIFAIGIAAGIRLKRGVPFIYSPWAMAVSAVIIVISFLVVSNGLGGRLGNWEALRPSIDIDKSNLGLGRLIHFIAVAYVVGVIGMGHWFKRTPFYSPMVVLGRHSLFIFAFGSLLDAVGQVLYATNKTPILVDLSVVLTGLMMLYGAARLAEFRSTVQKQARSAAPAAMAAPA